MALRAVESIRESVRAGETTVLPDKVLGSTAKQIDAAAEACDAVADCEVRETGERLGNMSLQILVDVLNPERILIGGLAVRLKGRPLGPNASGWRRRRCRCGTGLHRSSGGVG